MKKLFQKWLLLFVSIAFLLTFTVSWWIHSYLAKNSALELLRANLDDIRCRVMTTESNLKTVIAMSNSAALAKAHAFARIVSENPNILKDEMKLEKIRRELDVDELHVSDEKGILIASIPKKYQGYNMANSVQSSEFMPALNHPDFALVQEPRPNGAQKVLFQYTGVARFDLPGIIQIGYRPERIQEAMNLANIENIAASARIGHNGKLRISVNDDRFNDSRFNDDHFNDDRFNGQEKIFKDMVDGTPYLCLSVPCGKYILTATLPEEEMYLSRDSVLRILVIGNLVLFGVIFLLVSNLLQKVVIKGIYSINDSLEKITDGNLEEKVAVKNTPEFNSLSLGINATVNALKLAIESEAKRIDAELEMGRTIQTSVLPTDFPDNELLRLSAAMYTAKEVGGDFYDFFMIDDNHQAMIIADVSGKGITAALYMMNAKALLKEMILSGNSPADALTQANLELCRNNQAHMFLTAFLAVLNVNSGELVCVNAGHNPPLWKHDNGTWEYLRIKHSLVLGGSKKTRYQEVPIHLNPGDRLLLYTDGVTEAMNPAHEQYGEERLKNTMNASNGTPNDLIQNICEEVTSHANGTPQSDDITMLLLERKKGTEC